MRTQTVINGKLCIEQGGVRVWFDEGVIKRHIAKLEIELKEWQERLAILHADQQLNEADQPKGENK